MKDNRKNNHSKDTILGFTGHFMSNNAWGVKRRIFLIKKDNETYSFFLLYKNPLLCTWDVNKTNNLQTLVFISSYFYYKLYNYIFIFTKIIYKINKIGQYHTIHYFPHHPILKVHKNM